MSGPLQSCWRVSGGCLQSPMHEAAMGPTDMSCGILYMYMNPIISTGIVTCIVIKTRLVELFRKLVVGSSNPSAA